MAVGVVRATYGTGYAYQGTPQPASEEGGAEFSTRQEMEETDAGEVLGITTLPDEGGESYGMTAQYAEGSTKEDPIVKVISNYGGKTETYYVHVKEVDPEAATQLEMFALLSYADDQGFTDAGTFGSYHYLKLYAENAEENGYAIGMSGYGNFMWKKQDWSAAVKKIKGDYAEARLYGQVKKCESLIRAMEAVTNRHSAAANAAEEDIKTKSAAEEREERIAFLSSYIEEQLEKWKKGETKELSFQIGARLFTEKEWDALLEKFDAVMDTIRESMRQELERRKAEEQREKERKEEEAAKEANEHLLTESSLLLAEKTLCTGPSLSLDQPGPSYIVCYTEEGIVCRRTDCIGSEEWSISFGDKEQHKKVLDFLKRFSESENLVFASQEEFWKAFLQDEIDMDAFPYTDVAEARWEQHRKQI